MNKKSLSTKYGRQVDPVDSFLNRYDDEPVKTTVTPSIADAAKAIEQDKKVREAKCEQLIQAAYMETNCKPAYIVKLIVIDGEPFRMTVDRISVPK